MNQASKVNEASHQVHWKRSAEKELQRLPKETIIKILELVEILKQNPWPSADIKKLAGTENLYRARAGDYRLIYEFIKQEHIYVLYV